MRYFEITGYSNGGPIAVIVQAYDIVQAITQAGNVGLSSYSITAVRVVPAPLVLSAGALVP